MEKEGRVEKDYQVGLLEGQGTPEGTMTPPRAYTLGRLGGPGTQKRGPNPPRSRGGESRKRKGEKPA